MNTHLLIAVDAFTDAHTNTLAHALTSALDGGATWERLPEAAPATAFSTALTRADIAIGWIEPELIAASALRVLLCPSVGYEPYLGLGKKRDFTLCNAGDVYSSGLAEHTLALMLALVRRLPEYVRAMSNQTWQHMSGHGELGGKTVCIVGLGNMGRRIAGLCAAFGMTVIGVRRSTSIPMPAGVTQVFPAGQLKEAVAHADHVVAALPGGNATAKLFDKVVFASMKRGAYFYNLGRGSTVDEAALIDHLQIGHLAGAGLDVFAEEPLPESSPLWTMHNVIITPHMAGHTADYADRLVALYVENLRRYALNQPLLNVIDLTGG